MDLISDNGVSRVFRQGNWVIKHQPKFMTDNEIWCLKRMEASGFVPKAMHTGIEELWIEYIPNEKIISPSAFLKWYQPVLTALYEARIRHGDLTEYSVRVRANIPFLIDFSESRLWDDPRPDKRPEGDAFWLKKTMAKLCGS